MWEDVERVLSEWVQEARMQQDVMYDIGYDRRTITIYTTRPGWLIGMRGTLVNKYVSKMREVWPSFEKIYFQEIRGYVTRTEVK